jgi:hypothetical protein
LRLPVAAVNPAWFGKALANDASDLRRRLGLNIYDPRSSNGGSKSKQSKKYWFEPPSEALDEAKELVAELLPERDWDA